MAVHFDPDAPYLDRVPVNVASCGTAAPGDTATSTHEWVSCPKCLPVDVDQPCGRTSCRHPHDWTGGRCPGVSRTNTSTRTPLAQLAATARAQIGDRR